MSDVRVVDSSGWLEYLQGSHRSDLFAEAIEDKSRLIVPIISIYEVYKKVKRELGDKGASDALELMQKGRVIELDLRTVLDATTYRLSLADSLIYSVATQHSATLWTQDAHFEGLPGVKYIPM